METTQERRTRAHPRKSRPASRSASAGTAARKRPASTRQAPKRAARSVAQKRPDPRPARRPAAQQPPRATRRRHRSRAPEVVYTPPKPFSRNRLLLQLTTVVAVVLALTLGLSIFFKVEVVTVSGAQKYDPWTVKEASGIEIGDNLLSFGEARAAGKIKAALPYVDTVRIGIKLPDTVNIEIKEFDVVYAIRDAAEQWWLITAEGRVVEKADSAAAGDCTQILGVKLASPAVGQQAVAQEAAVPEATGDSGETVPQTVRASDQLSAALSILQHMESCGIIGQAASVDVTDLGSLELWYGQRFQVKLGDTSQLLRKIQWMNAAINGGGENSLKEYDSGILDITFTIKEDQVIYQAFTE